MQPSRFRSVLAVMSAISLGFLATTTANASRVSPMSVEIEPSGRGSVARVQFVNTSARDFPIEARAFRGVISEEGELELIPSDDDFIIFPPQRVIEPRGDQVFRLQYIGEPNLDRAQVYYLSIRQLPVELMPGDPQIQVLVNFNVFINVEPQNTVATPRVDTINAQARENVEGVEVRVANDGTGMLLAGELTWSLTGRNVDGTPFERKIVPAELANLVGVGVVAPGKARKFFLPIDATVDRSSIAITLE